MVSAVLNLFWANVHKRVLGRRYVEKRIYDYRMYLDLEDRGISRGLILFGEREIDHKIILEYVLRPGMFVLDIGANIGYYALMERGLVGAAGRVIAVEPIPSNVALLKRNLELNGYDDVTVVEGAVSDKLGTDRIHLAHESNLNTFHAVGTAVPHLTGESIEVSTLTVPELVAHYGKPDLIRMDVEGHEVEVVSGLLEAVRAGEIAPMILFETHLSRYSPEHDMERVLRDLFEFGYGVRYLASSYERGSALIDARGYNGSLPIPTDGVNRVIYENVGEADAIDFICHTGGARTVLLAPSEHRLPGGA